MRIIADTNLLLRAIVGDHADQSRAARELLAQSTIVAVSSWALSELAWVLGRTYGFSRAQVAQAIRAVVEAENVSADIAAAEAGLSHLEGGGDFADGIIAHQGRMLGGDIFVSFDRKAVALHRSGGGEAMLAGDQPTSA